MDLTIVENQLKKTPEEAKKLFFSVKTAEKISDIGHANGIDIDKIDDFIDETALTIIGLKSISKLAANISEKLGVDMATADVLASELNKSIFDSLRADLKEKYGVDEVEKLNEEKNNSIKSIEKAGGFEIEREVVKPITDEEAISDNTPSGLPDRVNLMDKTEATHSDPLVNQLLKQSAAVPEGKKEIQSGGQDQGPDPYKESIQ